MLWRAGRIREAASLAASLVLLCGAAIDRAWRVSPADARPYHARVRETAAGAPLSLGDWVGSDEPLPDEVLSLLRPNVVLSRRFINSATGEHFSLLLVQCWDVRDLVPHYPPVCYPGRGLTLVSARPRSWRAGDLPIPGTQYEFESDAFDTPDLTVVDHFMILPDGRITRDMADVKREVSLRDRYFGAAQVQFVFDSTLPLERRDEICNLVLSAYRPVIDAIRSARLQGGRQ